MNEQAELAWAELEAKAQRLLEHPKDLPPRDTIRRYGSVLRLWHYPAYGPHTSWTILQPGRKMPAGAPPLAREITWDRLSDNQRMSAEPYQLEPRLSMRDTLLPKDELSRLLDIGRELSVPIVVFSQTVGLDGEYFGLETYETSPFVKAQWWCQGPTEWRHFTDWFHQVRRFLLQYLDQAG